MKIKITQLKSKVPYDVLMEAFRKDAPLFNEIGLKWKIWLENKEEGIIGAIMLFKDQASYEKYPDPELVKKV